MNLKVNILPNNTKYNHTLPKKQQNTSVSKNGSQGITYAYPVFKCNSFSNLYKEYNWYIYHDKTPAIKSFLKMSEKPEIMDKFLTEILNTKDRSIEFFDSFLYSPRKSLETAKELKDKLGENSVNLRFYMPNSLYGKAYTNYLNNKFNNEKCLISLLKIRPDWRGDMLVQKYKKLYGNENVEIGNIPKELPKNHLNEIYKYLSGEAEYGLKTAKKIPSLTLDNRKYEFAFFTEGKSDKNVFGIFTPEGKKYVLKMGKPEMRSLDNPFAIGTLAKIDFYLTTHRCRNAAPICYYNHEKNFSIYKYIEHIPVDEMPSNMGVISKHLNDFRSLGMTYNDTVGSKNFFMLKPNSTDGITNSEGFMDGLNNKEWISVDNDHVTYSNILQPLISEYCSSLPNAMQMFF